MKTLVSLYMNITSLISLRSIVVLMALSIGISTTFAERSAPTDVPPVIEQGIKYTAPHFGEFAGQPRVNGQYIQARDAKTDKLLWELRVYEVKYDPELESDIQDVFITSLKIVKGNLEVVNEAGDKFVVDLSKRKVIEGANRVYESKLKGSKH